MNDNVIDSPKIPPMMYFQRIFLFQKISTKKAIPKNPMVSILVKIIREGKSSNAQSLFLWKPKYSNAISRKNKIPYSIPKMEILIDGGSNPKNKINNALWASVFKIIFDKKKEPIEKANELKISNG